MIDIDKQIEWAKGQVTSIDDSPPPTLVAEYMDGRIEVMVLAIDGHPYDIIIANASGLIHGTLRSLSLTSDSFTTTAHTDEHDLSVRFAQGDPDVSECVMVNIAQRGDDGIVRTTLLSCPYLRGAEAIEWAEPRTHDDENVGGRMTALLAAMVNASVVLGL